MFDLKMKARFFYAPAAYRTWPKLYVLTEDGTLYCEYLDYMQPAKDIKQVNFDNFKAEDYQFGGYQPLEEISYEVAKAKSLKRQSNWIDRYLSSKKVNSNTLTPNNRFDDILQYKRYYKACEEMEYGIHGPEVKDGKLYISIFHYLQFIGKNPKSYDTFSLGNYLTNASSYYETCQYACQNFNINKFDLDLLQKEEINFNKFLN